MMIPLTSDEIILIAINAAGISSILLVPKRRRREAHAVYLFQQLITWPLGLLPVELGLLEYPVHELGRANETSITFEFFIYPTVAAYFWLYYPRGRTVPVRLLYYAAFAGGITIPELLFEHYTKLIRYTGWHWYYTTLSISATLWLSRRLGLWFFAGQVAGFSKRGRL
ncbi:CBO0543 family protein [Paenibacillus humicola]|uniref:CBO0543 family protein n=1 Tax=Paenibacillus humicola TaxID=3110540 RepID=UPI00237A25FB|nr:CBO0543 family protein [Paenibacillus humicola]